MTIVNVGVSHRIAPADVLEKLVVPSAELGDVLARLHAVPTIDEVVVLSTCNRVEVYAAASGPVELVTRAVAARVAARGRIPVHEVLRMARIHVGAAAAGTCSRSRAGWIRWPSVRTRSSPRSRLPSGPPPRRGPPVPSSPA